MSSLPPDPVAALGDAWRRARQALSFSSVRGREETGCPSVLLKLLDNRFFGQAADTTAKPSVSVLDHDGNQLYTWAGEPQSYSLYGSSSAPSGVWMDVMDDGTPEETKETLSRLKDDCLIVQCDLTVQRSDNESGLGWFLSRYLD